METANVRCQLHGGYVRRDYRPTKERNWDEMLKLVKQEEKERVLISVKVARPDMRKQVEEVDEKGKKVLIDNEKYGRIQYENVETFEVEGVTGKQAADELRAILSGTKR